MGVGSVKRIGLAMLASVLFCACAASNHTDGERPAAMIPPDEQSARKQMVFLVDSSRDDVYRRAAELFAAKVNEYTDNILTVEVSSSVEAAKDFLAGKAQLVFLDGKRNAALSEDFAVLSAPMRYTDFKTYTMAINSARMMEALNDRLAEDDILLLTGVYQGTNYFVAGRATVGGDFEPEDGEEDDAAALAAAVLPDSGIEPLLREYGMEVTADRSFPGRLQLLLEQTVTLAEFTAKELVAVDWSGGHYLYATNHSITPGWLAMDKRLYDELSPAYQAVILEACAYLGPVIDGYFTELETNAEARLRSQGVTVKSFDGLQKTAARLEAPQDALDQRDRYLTGIIDSMA